MGEHDENEERWVMLGQAENGQYLVVIHTVQYPSPADIAVRIISARVADRDEIRDYEEMPR